MQKKDPLLVTLFILIWGITLMHACAVFLYWYWTYRWFDVPMHFLGGMWVGLFLLWIWFRSGYVKKVSRPLIVSLVGVLCIGLVWEGYEYAVWMLLSEGLPFGYYGDTLKDVCMDLLGAGGAYLLYKKTPFS